jgi:peptidoglycan/LPS O-acetylase OafA/YrhL
MFAGSIVLALTVLGFTGWLQYHEVRGWPEEGPANEFSKRYLHRRRRTRRRVHVLLVLCSVLIAVAAFVGPGRVWIGCWMTVILTLFVIILLAMIDAMRTHRFLREKIPQIGDSLINESLMGKSFFKDDDQT